MYILHVYMQYVYIASTYCMYTLHVYIACVLLHVQAITEFLPPAVDSTAGGEHLAPAVDSTASEIPRAWRISPQR